MKFPIQTKVLCSICSTPLYALNKETQLKEDVTVSMLTPITPQPKAKNVNKEKCHNCSTRISYSKFELPDNQILTYRMGVLIDANGELVKA